MYSPLIFLHSLNRWLLLLLFIWVLFRACRGYARHKPFTKIDNALRHWTATVAHIQLILGIMLYIRSPVTSYFWKQTRLALQTFEIGFFALVHSLMMFGAIVILTAGSAIAKRKKTDQEKFRTILLWYSIAFLIIIIAIPWPFSPLAKRPYFR